MALSFFSWIVRGLQLLFGIILLGVAAGGTTHIYEPSLNFLVFVGAWVMLVLIYVVIVSFFQSFHFPLIMFVLEALTLLFLIIGVIVVPATLFNTSSTGRNECRLVLDGTAERAGLTGNVLHEARVGCQCALTAAIFDGLSCLLWIVSLVLVLIAWRRTK